MESGEPSCSAATISKDEFNVVVYECSVCGYRTINKSNLNTHIRTKCVEGTVRKRRGVVRVLDIEDDQVTGSTAAAQPVPEHVMEDQNARRLRKAMEGRVPLERLDERVTFFMYTDEGRRVLMDIFSKASLIDSLLFFIKYYTGNAAPIACRSIAKYGSKGKSLAIVRELDLTYPRLRRCVTVDLLAECYVKFRYICEQPVYRDDVPRAMQDAAKVMLRKLDQPIDRSTKKRTLTLKEILDTRRSDDDVMNVLVEQFPMCLSFVDAD